VLWRTYTESKKTEPRIVRRPSDSFFAQPKLLYTLGSLMVFSGILCFLLRRNWFMHIDYKLKIPFFAILGVSFAFIIMFLFADCINYCALACSRSQTKPIIDSNHQVYLLVGAATFMGFTYGLIFGLLDVEDASMYKLSILALKQESFCYPIGLVLGFFAGLINEFIRERGGQLQIDNTTPRFEQEI